MEKKLYPCKIEKLEKLKIKSTKVPCKIKIQNINTSSQYCIVSYNKENLQENYLDKYSVFKNIIFNTHGNALSVFPPKNIDSEFFLLHSTDYYGEEMIYGTPFTLFWDKSIGLNGAWEIAGMNSIGGKLPIYHFKQYLTLKNIFLLFCEKNPTFLNNLNNSYVYHFVLQYIENLPENISDNIDKFKIFLIDIFIIKNNEKKCIIETLFKNEKDKSMFFKLTKWEENIFPIFIPKIYSKEECLFKIIAFNYLNGSYLEKGIILRNVRGFSCKIVNSSFKYVKILKSIEPKYQYLFLELKKSNKIKLFVSQNNFYKVIFQHLFDYLDIYYLTLYKNYINCFIKKSTKLESYHETFIYLCKKIHSHYLLHLKPSRLYCTQQVIKEIFNACSVEEQMYFLSFQVIDRRNKLNR